MLAEADVRAGTKGDLLVIRPFEIKVERAVEHRFVPVGAMIGQQQPVAGLYLLLAMVADSSWLSAIPAMVCAVCVLSISSVVACLFFWRLLILPFQHGHKPKHIVQLFYQAAVGFFNDALHALGFAFVYRYHQHAFGL